MFIVLASRLDVKVFFITFAKPFRWELTKIFENDRMLAWMLSISYFYAGMVELVDSVDLGSTAKSVQVRVLLPAPCKRALAGSFLFIGNYRKIPVDWRKRSSIIMGAM